MTEQVDRDDDRTVALPVVDRDTDERDIEETDAGTRGSWLRQPSFAGFPRATWIGIAVAAALALAGMFALGYTVGRTTTESAYQRVIAPSSGTSESDSGGGSGSGSGGSGGGGSGSGTGGQSGGGQQGGGQPGGWSPPPDEPPF